MGKRVVWLLAACTGLVLFLRGDGLAYMAAAPRAVGIGGWGLVGMGFLTVALTALRGPGEGKSRPSLHPYRPAAENFFKKPSKITIYGGFCAKL